MNSSVAFARVAAIQTGFELVSLMHFTAYLFPKQASVQDGASYDFIVAGAGTAGSVIASRLSEDKNIKVLLVEAGGDPPMESILPAGIAFLKRSRYDWNFTSEVDGISELCHQNPYFEMSLGKMLGGTSSLDYMVYSRGHKSGYDSWAEIVKDDSWKWDNVLPYFEKSVKMPNSLDSVQENTGHLVLTGIAEDENDILTSFKELGHDLVHDTLGDIGYSRMLHLISDTGRRSSARAYLTPAKDRTNLHVLKEALVTKINIVDNKAVGVEIETDGGQTINVIANREVIVSAGALNTPKLLMLSGIGPKEHLEEKNIKVITDLPVGKNLQDHVGVVIQHTMEEHEPIYINPYQPPVTFPTIGYVALDKTQNYPDYETMSFYAHDNLLLHFCAYVYRLSYEICDEIYKEGRMGMFSEIINLNPKSRGEVKLRSADPKDRPIITTGYLTNEEDLDNLVKYVQKIIPLVNTTYFKSIGAEMVNPIPNKCVEHELWSTEYWKCYTRCHFSGLSSYSGTCAMGSVVDSRLKVYGVENLRVADGSIMPIITRGNPMGPIAMIGEKAADMIKVDNNL